MLKKFSNTALIGVLVVLVGVYALIEFTGNKKRSSSLRSTLVEIDTAKVTGVKVFGKTDTVHLASEDGQWKVTIDGGKQVNASKPSVDNALIALLSIQPSRMASKSEAKWKDYQVDTAGTRVQVFEGNDKTLDIILGRFGMEGRNSYHTFVRLTDDKEVYAANNFMSFSVGTEPSSYRDQVLARIKKDSLTSVTLTYPSDSSVQMVSSGDYWMVNGQIADSANVAQYISKLAYLNSQAFVDDQSNLTVPTVTAAFSFSNAEDIVIEGYLRGEDDWVIHSAYNDEAYFADKDLFNKIFVGNKTFF